MATPEERIAALEARASNIENSNKETWDAIEKGRDKFDDLETELRGVIGSEVGKVCEKLTACQTRHDVDANKNEESLRRLGEEVRVMVKEEIENLLKAINKIWGITWKALVLFTTILIAIVGWQWVLAARIANTEQKIVRMETKQEHVEKTSEEVIVILKDIQQEIKEEN